MSDLGQDARSLVAQTRLADGPSAEDRARIRAKLDPTWAAFRARQAGGYPSGTAVALAKRRTPWGTLALWLSLSLWPAQRPRSEALAGSTALQPLAATTPGSGSRPARALQLMASAGAGSSTAQPDRASAPGALAGASRDGSSRRAGFAAALPRDAEANGATRAELRRRDRSAPAARSASGTQAAIPAHSAALPNANPAHVSPIGSAGRSPSRPNAIASDASRNDNPVRNATTPNAIAGDTPRSALLPNNTSRAMRASSSGNASPTPNPAARGADTAESGDSTPSQRDAGFVPQPLDDELEWIGAAQDALRKGQPTTVLRLVQEHAFRYPQGALAPERLALHTLALCALQRRAAARTVLAELARRTPSSPLLDRVRRNCGL